MLLRARRSPLRLADQLRSALREASPRVLAGDDSAVPSDDAIPAAVLVAVTDREQPGVILTVRRDNLRTHAGQIAFPGGRIDPGEDPAAAAIREAWEELSLDPDRVEPVAALDAYCTITGYLITPLLAVVPPDLPLTPHDDEVADWFEAPLAFLLDQANQRHESVLFEGRERHYYRIDWEGRKIWGATAAMLVNLSRRLRWS